MELLILVFLPLFSNILTNCLFVPMSPYSAYKISFGPKFSTPELLLDFRALRKDLLCRYAFDRLNYLLRAVSRHGLNEKMHMLSINANF